MINPAIQTEEDPLRHFTRCQKVAGAADQIVKIKPATLFLGHVIGRQKGRGKGVKRMGFLGQLQPAPQRSGLLQAEHEVVQRFKIFTHGIAGCFIGISVNLGLIDLCSRAEQEQVFKRAETCEIGAVPIGAAQNAAVFVISGDGGQQWDQLAAEITFIALKCLRNQPV